MNQELTTPTQLENHLWASANILRGPVDATEILGWYHGFAFVQDAGRAVTLDEIKPRTGH